MDNNTNHQRDAKIDELMRKIGAETGTGEKLKQAAGRNPAVASAIKNLSDNDIARINAILSDPEATKKILATTQAQMLLHQLKKQS